MGFCSVNSALFNALRLVSPRAIVMEHHDLRNTAKISANLATFALICGHIRTSANMAFLLLV